MGFQYHALGWGSSSDDHQSPVHQSSHVGGHGTWHRSSVLRSLQCLSRKNRTSSPLLTGPKFPRTGVDCRYCHAGPPHSWPCCTLVLNRKLLSWSTDPTLPKKHMYYNTVDVRTKYFYCSCHNLPIIYRFGTRLSISPVISTLRARRTWPWRPGCRPCRRATSCSPCSRPPNRPLWPAT